MAIFEIKDTIKIMMAEIYEVEAETKKEALEKYINELAGGLELKREFIVDDLKESVTVITD